MATQLEQAVEAVLQTRRDGNERRWLQVLQELEKKAASIVRLDTAAPVVGNKVDLSLGQQARLKNQLLALKPWRKGPFSVFGIDVDTEWRSDTKWSRLEQEIAPLKDRFVLDIGSGNGYYALRMLGAEAKAVVAIDPFRLYVLQFQALNKYIQTDKTAVLPLRLEDVQHIFVEQPVFHSIFSMGVLYHRRNPSEHLKTIKDMLLPGGQLILETLILDREDESLLYPEGRYAKMPNVWSVPAPKVILQWLGEQGFSNPRLIDVSRTSPAEQRRTEWMDCESLSDYLDAADPSLTVEGHPSPVRAVFLAEKN